jgi:hypothetical protein
MEKTQNFVVGPELEEAHRKHTAHGRRRIRSTKRHWGRALA